MVKVPEDTVSIEFVFHVPGTLTVLVADPKLIIFAPVAAAWIFKLPVLEAALQSETVPVVAVS